MLLSTFLEQTMSSFIRKHLFKRRAKLAKNKINKNLVKTDATRKKRAEQRARNLAKRQVRDGWTIMQAHDQRWLSGVNNSVRYSEFRLSLFGCAQAKSNRNRNR